MMKMFRIKKIRRGCETVHNNKENQLEKRWKRQREKLLNWLAKCRNILS